MTMCLKSLLLASHLMCFNVCRRIEDFLSASSSDFSAWTKMTTAFATCSSTSRSATSARVLEWVFQRKCFAWKQRSFMPRSVAVQEVLQQFFALAGKNRFGMKLHAFHGKTFVTDSHDDVVSGTGANHQFSREMFRIDDQRMIAHGRKGIFD